MNRIVTILFALILVATVADSQIPTIISYSGFLADSIGNPLNGSLAMKFRLYDDSTAGFVDWSQTIAGVSLTNGVYTVQLDLSGANFTLAYWLELEVNGQKLAPRTRLTSVPFAIKAEDATNARYLRLPFTGSGTTPSGSLIEIFNTGTVASGAGYFENSNAANPDPALAGRSYGTGDGIVGETYAGTNGVNGLSATLNGNGVIGVANNGTAAYGVYGVSSGGYAVVGRSTGGVGVMAQGGDNVSSPNTALLITGGALRVSGSVKPAFVHEVSVVSGGTSSVFNSLINGDPNAIIIVTPMQNTATVPATDIRVLYNSGLWYLASPSLAPGMKYNILIINQ